MARVLAGIIALLVAQAATADRAGMLGELLAISTKQAEISIDIPETGLVAFYDFDGGSLSSYDGSHTLTNSSASGIPIFTGGRSGDCLFFSQATNSPVLHSYAAITGYPFSCGAWVREDAVLPINDVILGFNRTNSITIGAWIVGVSADRDRIFQDGGTARASSGGITWTTGTWHHTAAVFDGPASMSLYVNGSLDVVNSQNAGTNLVAIADGLFHIMVGNKFPFSASTTGFDGYIDDVFFYSRSLASNEVKAIYESNL